MLIYFNIQWNMDFVGHVLAHFFKGAWWTHWRVMDDCVCNEFFQSHLSVIFDFVFLGCLFLALIQQLDSASAHYN